MFGKEIKQITVEELKKINNKKTVIIDVREQNEYDAKHIPNAINVPYKTLIKNPSEYITGTTYLICNSGGSSRKAVRKLSKKEFDVIDVKGGVNAYGHRYGLIRTQKLVVEDKKTKK